MRAVRSTYFQNKKLKLNLDLGSSIDMKKIVKDVLIVLTANIVLNRICILNLKNILNIILSRKYSGSQINSEGNYQNYI